MVAKIEHKTRTGCPIANALDVVGDHWTLLIVRNLMFTEANEFKDMLRADEKISSSILTVRLKKLEEDGLINSIPHPDSKRRKLYYLTTMGKNLIHVMVALILWAGDHLSEHLDIPKEKKILIENDTNAFIQVTLDRLEAWETKYLR